MSGERNYNCEKCGKEVKLSIPEFLRLRAGKWGKKVLCDSCTDVTVVVAVQVSPDSRVRTMPTPTTRLTLAPAERDDYGVTMTIRSREGGINTICGFGPVVEATRECATKIDARGGGWRVVSVSTPSTIYADMQGYRDLRHSFPEPDLLSKIGRTDLLETPLKQARRLNRRKQK